MQLKYIIYTITLCHAIYFMQVNGFAINSVTSTTASLSWSQTNTAAKYYNISITDLDTLTSPSNYILDFPRTSTVISSLHPNHRYQFSIALFTVALGTSVDRNVRLLQAGIATLY